MQQNHRFVLGVGFGLAIAAAFLVNRAEPRNAVSRVPVHAAFGNGVGGIHSAAAQTGIETPQPAPSGSTSAVVPLEPGSRFTRWGISCERAYGPVEEVRGSWVLASGGEAGRAWHNIAMWPDLEICP